jgi:hypothetical protein
MFPDESFNIHPFHPLDWCSFRNNVLTPEAGTLLIQQDFPHLDRKAAIETMQKSQGFGSLMHPGTDSLHVDAIIKQVVCTDRNMARLRVKDKTEEVAIRQSEVEFKSVIEDGKTVFILDD